MRMCGGPRSRKGGAGAKRSRAVICGNLALEQADPLPQVSPVGPTHGALGHRCWRPASITSLDVKSAFLQAPRPHQPVPARWQAGSGATAEGDGGLGGAHRMRFIRKALHGFSTSQSYWAIYRDQVLPGMIWEEDNIAYQLIQTKEHNLWRIVEKET